MTEPLPEPGVVERCRAGDQDAAAELYASYVQRLVSVAQRRLSSRFTARFDAEDVVQSAFRTFFSRLQSGQFDIKDNDDLWNLLSRITLHKTLKQIDFHRCLRRDAGKEVGASESNHDMIVNYLAAGPTPDEAALFMDELEYFLNRLGPEDRQIIELRLEGHSNMQIAEKLQITDRKIRRLMERMRDLADMDRLLF